jgi:hypothetical protein
MEIMKFRTHLDTSYFKLDNLKANLKKEEENLIELQNKFDYILSKNPSLCSLLNIISGKMVWVSDNIIKLKEEIQKIKLEVFN